jgi:hypothetical protein
MKLCVCVCVILFNLCNALCLRPLKLRPTILIVIINLFIYLFIFLCHWILRIDINKALDMILIRANKFRIFQGLKISCYNEVR